MVRKFSVALILAVGFFIQRADMAYMDVNSFFNVKNNLTRITWAHAVNSQEKLNNSLNSTVMMLEADVSIGQLNGTNKTDIPIMAHPPDNTSDLSLESFLDQIMQYNSGNVTQKKGIKLDFKSIEAYEKSLTNLTNNYIRMNYPVWINADIIEGPLNGAQPVNSTRFFDASRVFTNSTLSIGWTTNIPVGEKNISYSDRHINDMLNAMRASNVNQSITFPVRAGIAANSLDQMMTLLNNASRSTLTIWSGENDVVNVTNLRSLIKKAGLSRTFIDVPKDLESQLKLNTIGGGCNLTPVVNVVLAVLALIYVL